MNTYFIKVIFLLVSIVLGLISFRQNFSVFLEYERNVSYFMVYIHKWKMCMKKPWSKRILGNGFKIPTRVQPIVFNSMKMNFWVLLHKHWIAHIHGWYTYHWCKKSCSALTTHGYSFVSDHCFKDMKVLTPIPSNLNPKWHNCILSLSQICNQITKALL